MIIPKRLQVDLLVLAALFSIFSRWSEAFFPGTTTTRIIIFDGRNSLVKKGPFSHYVLQASSRSNENFEFPSSSSSLPEEQEKATRESLVKSKLQLADRLVPLEWLGVATLPSTSENLLQTCLVLGTPSSEDNNNNNKAASCQPALVVPLEYDNSLRLLQAAQEQKPLSTPLLLRFNTVAVNRDNAMFDNLPWASWTIDPSRRNYDAAGNPIAAKFHLGKRDAYNVLLGKDWGRSVSSSLLRELQNAKDRVSLSDDDDSENILARRVLELQLREARMDLADCDYQIAVAHTMNEAWELEDEREILSDRLSSLQTQLDEMMQDSSTLADQVLNEWRQRQGMGQREEGPYRGATGYAPRRDKNGDNVEACTSPYDMLRSILKDQLKAEVIGTVLENTSLLEGTIALGGVLVLRRITATQSTTIAGETLTVSDETQDYGNLGIAGGEIVVVECDVDEALGMSLACNVPLQVEQSVWERSSLMVQPTNKKELRPSSLRIDQWATMDPELSVLLEGQAGNQSATERVAPLRIPGSTTSLWDAIRQPATATSTDKFPTDNPIKSLSQLDQLSNEDKARTLLSMSNFEGRLPRPRVVQQSEQGDSSKMNALDRLLIPLIDESVRREYYIRQALQSGDLELAQELESSKSMRQIAKEKVARAIQAGEPEVAKFWEQEAEFYASLRADVTQDEGSYSRFLDSDEWYERERRKTAARVDPKKFGNLLDGIE